MHFEVENFISNVKFKFPSFFYAKKVLECGSLNINGSIRKYFRHCDYTGIDICKGNDVDIVIKVSQYLKEEMYDVVVSTEMLEHDEEFAMSMRNMYKNLKSGGLLMITCAGMKRAEHGTTRTSPADSPMTNDHYRNIFLEDVEEHLPIENFSEYYLANVRNDMDLLFYGIKR